MPATKGVRHRIKKFHAAGRQLSSAKIPQILGSIAMQDFMLLCSTHGKMALCS